MNNQRISWDIKVDGTLLSMPSVFHMGVENGQFKMQGNVQTEQMNLTEVIRLLDSSLAEKYGTYINKMTGLFPKETYFEYTKNKSTLWFKGKEQQFAMMWQENDMALLYAICMEDGQSKEGIEYYLSMVVKTLGIKQIFLSVKKGNLCTLSKLIDFLMEQRKELVIPRKMSAYDFLFFGSFVFNEQTIIGQALGFLFGVKGVELNLFIALSKQGMIGYVALPTFESSVLKAKELYFGIEVDKKKVGMMLSGTFIFSFLEGVVFQIECRLSNQGFLIEAFAKIENPKPLFHTFSIGDTCLAVGYESGFVFQMFANLYMGKIKIFGALGLNVKGTLVTVDLLAAAVTDITLPIFVESILGKKIDGLETFDFIQLLGLPFAQIENFYIDKNMSKEQVAELFNGRISDKSFNLNAQQIQVETFDKGTILIDKKRMRHYYITEQGKLQLQAQFCYATRDMTLGDYSITQGIFLCCTIRLFQKIEFQALFSLSDSDGVLAYACIKNLDLGFFKLTSSGFNTKEDNFLTKLPEKSLLRQFVSPDQQGAVFYLRAGANEVSFYIDAKMEFLELFQCAARILYIGKQVSVDVGFSIISGINVFLHISASYENFSNANISFSMKIDCTGLEEKLKQVQEKINTAIETLKNKINNANKQLTKAQNQVDELYGQIASLDRKIENCKSDIRNAKWYKKAFVAIAKGVEIAAYEVAKVSLYAAIGVAKAALEVAKQIVSLGGIVGEGVLKAVKGAITATLNLFFVRYICLESSVSLEQQYFDAEIEFVALGKTYHYKTTMGRKALAENPTKALGDNINNTMNNDLNNIEKGAFRSNRNRYSHEEYTIEQHKKRLKDGMQHLESATRLMCGMQETYVEGCGESMPEFEEINVSYQQAVQEVSGMLDIAHRAMDFGQMNQAVSMVEQTIQEKKETVRDGTFATVKSAITDYKEATELLDMIGNGVLQVDNQSDKLKEHMNTIKQSEKQYQKETISSGNKPKGDMVEILNKTEEMMYQQFPVSRNKKDFINLSREKLIHQYFDDAREEFAGEGTDNIKNMRVRATKGRYQSRL